MGLLIMSPFISTDIMPLRNKLLMFRISNPCRATAERKKPEGVNY